MRLRESVRSSTARTPWRACDGSVAPIKGISSFRRGYPFPFPHGCGGGCGSCAALTKVGHSLSQKRMAPFRSPKRKAALPVSGLNNCAACGMYCYVHGFAMSLCESVRPSTARTPWRAVDEGVRRQTGCKTKNDRIGVLLVKPTTSNIKIRGSYQKNDLN